MFFSKTFFFVLLFKLFDAAFCVLTPNKRLARYD